MDSAASYVPCSSRSAANARRPASEVAVMAPPMMMPAIGTRPAPVSGTAPEAKITVSTGTTPDAMATATHGHERRAPIRLDDVATATPIMTTANSADQATWTSTAAITVETTASWITARNAAVAKRRSSRSRPTNEAVIAIAKITIRATARAGPGCAGTRPFWPDHRGLAALAGRIGWPHAGLADTPVLAARGSGRRAAAADHPSDDSPTDDLRHCHPIAGAGRPGVGHRPALCVRHHSLRRDPCRAREHLRRVRPAAPGLARRRPRGALRAEHHRCRRPAARARHRDRGRLDRAGAQPDRPVPRRHVRAERAAAARLCRGGRGYPHHHRSDRGAAGPFGDVRRGRRRVSRSLLPA